MVLLVMQLTCYNNSSSTRHTFGLSGWNMPTLLICKCSLSSCAHRLVIVLILLRYLLWLSVWLGVGW